MVWKPLFVRVFALLVASINFIDTDAAKNFQYPADRSEIEIIDLATKTPKGSSQDLVEAVSQSIRGRLESLKDKRSIELLEAYLELAAISQDNCNQQHADELVFLLHAHQHDPESNSFKYVQEIATRQFELCLPLWDQQFAAAIYSIDKSDRDKMDRLLDQMMQIKFRYEAMPSKPYKDYQMRKLIASPPASAILLFMVSLDPREQRIPVDENLKNLSFKWDDFQKVYADFVLRLCSNVCDSLESASRVFRPAFDYNLEPSRYVIKSDVRSQWIASKMICCSIKRSHENKAKTGEDVFMRSTFDELTIQEEIMIENELGLDELVAFGNVLGG